jgi:hypothetical protein
VWWVQGGEEQQVMHCMCTSMQRHDHMQRFGMDVAVEGY